MEDRDVLERLLRCVAQGHEKSEDDLQELASQFKPTTQTVKFLADTCRDPEWRLPLAQAGFLQAILDAHGLAVTTDDEMDLTYQKLRFVCNSIADEDENRAIVRPHCLKICGAAENEALRLPALSAILNLCQDYDPGAKELLRVKPHLAAQFQTYLTYSDHQLTPVILNIIATILPLLDEESYKDWPVLGRCLESAILCITDAPGATTPQYDFIACMDALMPLLRVDQVQTVLARDLSLCMNLLENGILRLTGRQRLCAVDALEDDSDDADVEAEVAELRAHVDELVASLANIAFSVSIKSVPELHASEPVQDALRWLGEEWRIGNTTTRKEPDHIRFARAGALVLGNIATQEWIVQELVSATKIVSIAEDAILGSNDRELQSAAAGLLHNLAIPKPSKELIADFRIFPCVTKLLSSKQDTGPDVEISLCGLKLLRVILLDSLKNCEKLLSTETNAGAYAALTTLPQRAPSTDGRISTETGRALVALHRTYAAAGAGAGAGDPSSDSATARLAQLTQLPAMTASVVSLVSHPDARNKSQGWMGLAMISSEARGAKVVWDCFRTSKRQLDGALKDLADQVASKDGSMSSRDRDNAMMVLANLKRHHVCEEESDEMRSLRTMYAQWLKITGDPKT